MADPIVPGNTEKAPEETLDELLKQNGEAKDLETLRKLNEKIFARTKSAEEKLKENKGIDADSAKRTPPESKTEDAPLSTMELVTLQADGYSNTEIVSIAKMAKDMKMTPAALMANPIIKAGIDAQRKTNRGRDGTPAPSGRVGSIPSQEEIDGYNEAANPKEKLGTVLAHSKKVFEKRVQGGGAGSDE